MNPAPDRTTCRELADDLAAVALGGLTGSERVSILEHVEDCPSCAVELESLATGADALLLLYPEMDPGPDFTARVTARIRQERPRPRRRRNLVLAVAAGLVALALSLGLVVAGTSHDQPTQVTATLQSPAGLTGDVVLTSGHGNWMKVTLDDAAGGPTTLTCAVTLSDGSTADVGTYTLRGGYGGSWTVKLPAPPSSVTAVTVTNQDGQVVATAKV